MKTLEEYKKFLLENAKAHRYADTQYRILKYMGIDENTTQQEAYRILEERRGSLSDETFEKFKGTIRRYFFEFREENIIPQLDVKRSRNGNRKRYIKKPPFVTRAEYDSVILACREVFKTKHKEMERFYQKMYIHGEILPNLIGELGISGVGLGLRLNKMANHLDNKKLALVKNWYRGHIAYAAVTQYGCDIDLALREHKKPFKTYSARYANMGYYIKNPIKDLRAMI